MRAVTGAMPWFEGAASDRFPAKADHSLEGAGEALRNPG